jgi:exodeoxyribonuclease VII large subunit
MVEKIKLYSVSEFVQFLRGFLETNIGRVAIQGEVTGFRISNDRFVWLDVKDENSVLNCFMLKNELTTPLEDGMEVKILATPQLFVKSGKFHMRVHAIELVGQGALQKAFELLKKKLSEEGLFAEERKKAIPVFPETIGLITSADAAAYTDVLRILNNRWAGLTIKHFPAKVQGLGAPKTIVEAFSYFNTKESVDVIILTRGGGSLEDLQAFNSEAVARAVAGSAIPVVCGVGHERDESLAEYVADVRASTPSNAAERVVPDKRELHRRIQGFAGALALKLFQEQQRQLHSVGSLLLRAQSRVEERIEGGAVRINASIGRVISRIEGSLAFQTERVTSIKRVLRSCDPKAVLQRGYSIARKVNGKLIRSVKDVSVGESIQTRFADGDITSTVK